MSFFSLINAEGVTVVTDRPVIPAAEVGALATALDAARRLSELHERAEERVRAAEEEARKTGHRKGLAVGAATAVERLSERLLVLERETEREREALRGRAIDNALDIVRRIAASLGDAETLAALALAAARELLPCGAIVVQVHPDRFEGVRGRLESLRRAGESGGGTGAEPAPADVALHVEIETSLEPGECRLRSSNGATVLAGLETQLRRIERQALAAAGALS